MALLGAAQTNDVIPKRPKFAFYAGIGPNYYINNLVLVKKKVNELNYTILTRLMWEPEHRLSLGIESGYNRLYTIQTNLTANNIKIRIVSAAIPIHIVVSMKVYKSFYTSFTMGQSLLLNDIYISDTPKVHSSKFSLGDYSAAIGYKRSIKNRIYLGAEIKGFYFSQLGDKNIALAFFAGVRF